MSIDGNIVMALTTGNTGASALGNSNVMNNNSSVATGESVFQKLISQVLTNNSPVLETETAINNGSTAPEGISDFLSELLLGSGNAAKLELLFAGNCSSESSDSGKLLEDDFASMEFDEESMEAMQAMLSGGSNAFLFKNSEIVNSEILRGESTLENPINTIEAVQTEGNDFVGYVNTKNIMGSQESINNGEILTGSLEETAAFIGSAAEMSESIGSTVEMTGIEGDFLLKNNKKDDNSSNVGLVEPVNVQQSSLNPAKPDAVSKSEFKINEVGIDGQNLVGESELKQQGVTASNERSDMESDSGNDSLKATEFQGQIQNAGTAKEAVAVSQLNQPVEETEAYSQIREEILTKLEQKGPTEFKLQLQPEDLGKIDISLKLSEGKLIIDILANSSKTQALLTSQVDKLISSMGLQNVQVESVHVSQQMNPDSQYSQNQGYSMGSGMDFSQRGQHSQETNENLRQNSWGFSGTQDVEVVSARSKRTLNSINKMDYVI